jgi:hypothetical protein
MIPLTLCTWATRTCLLAFYCSFCGARQVHPPLPASQHPQEGGTTGQRYFYDEHFWRMSLGRASGTYQCGSSPRIRHSSQTWMTISFLIGTPLTRWTFCVNFIFDAVNWCVSTNSLCNSDVWCFVSTDSRVSLLLLDSLFLQTFVIAHMLDPIWGGLRQCRQHFYMLSLNLFYFGHPWCRIRQSDCVRVCVFFIVERWCSQEPPIFHMLEQWQRSAGAVLLPGSL